MNSTFYLQRNLTNGNKTKTYTELELLEASKFIVVLAEPGGGKTELMKSLAQQLGVSVVTANVFASVGADSENSALVIDAFDELAKVDQSGIHKLLGYVRKSKPTRVIISSRSSEWESASTSIFEQFLGSPPLVVWLDEFDQNEQRAIFDNYAPGEIFSVFQMEVARFSLDMLLPNPQFLKMFADAYRESGRSFSSKYSIFMSAVEYLAKEANKNISSKSGSLSIPQKISLFSEICAKLLLSGAEGVSTAEAVENRMYPSLSSLLCSNVEYNDILHTRLFKPGDNEDQHRPVHKIVAEYCAASYLIKRIADPGDVLTLAKCLPLIAPNSVVRDELRGLLGWMAALGNKSIQETTIALDPYAVLANGDPSQLECSSKRQLLNQLKEIETADPYFRRADFWRRFSVAGFFTQDIIEEIKPLLITKSEGHLRDLILELLVDSSATDQFQSELRQIILSSDEFERTRKLATNCLIKTPGYYFHDELSVLIFEASNVSLNLVAKIIEALGAEKFSSTYLAGYFRVCANLYPAHDDRSERVTGSRYFIKVLLSVFSQQRLEILLDNLAQELICICGKKCWECDCRNGISKIIGSMLDRYFELTQPPYDPIRVWQWIQNLNFHNYCNADSSLAVKKLQSNKTLRQGIIAHVFAPLTNRDQIFDIKVSKFEGSFHFHSGLQLQKDDHKFILDLAFILDNVDLWISFFCRHQNYRKKEERGPDGLRRHMREQALLKAPFMSEWMLLNRAIALSKNERKNLDWGKHSRKMRRRNRKQREIRAKNIQYINEFRDVIESGNHMSCLKQFAKILLMSEDKIELEFGDDALVRRALRNSLEFIAPVLPDLSKLADLQCKSRTLYSEFILYAACLEVFRAEGTLNRVNTQLLTVLRTNIHTWYKSVSIEEQTALKSEVDRLIFSNSNENAERYLRQYLEPQLAKSCDHPEIQMLNEEIFSKLRDKFSIEWLTRFSNLNVETLDTLFEIAAQYAEREKLKSIIKTICSSFMSLLSNQTDNEIFERKRVFWLIREFYFLDDIEQGHWEWLKSNKNNLLYFYECSGVIGRSDHKYWPPLTAIKIEAILDAFFEQWPQVELPDYFDRDSSEEEKHYRFMTELVWLINSDVPENSIPVLCQLLNDSRFTILYKELKSIHAEQSRKKALRDFEPPTPLEIVSQLDCGAIVTVEGLRQLVLQELYDFQRSINGGEFNSGDRFYEKGEHLNEVKSTEIIAERLNLRLEPLGISITPEHQLKDQKRSDFTASKLVSRKRRLLVTEVKGQWHRDLYAAASAQLYERYSIHSDAEQQGIFLVIWFGADEKVAGRKDHGIKNAHELKLRIEEFLPDNLRGFIDIFILDVSRAVS